MSLNVLNHVIHMPKEKTNGLNDKVLEIAQFEKQKIDNQIQQQQHQQQQQTSNPTSEICVSIIFTLLKSHK